MVPPVASEAPSITQIAISALRDADNDRENAKRLMRSWIDADQELRQTIIEQLIEQAISDSVRLAVGVSNRVIVNSRPGRPDDPRGISSSASYTYILPSGVKLGDAKQDDLRKSALRHELDGRANLRKSKWLNTIADKIGDRRVRDAISEDQIAKLWEAAR